MKVIKQVQGLTANGHYALAVVEERRVYVSGQFSVDPENGTRKYGSAEEETVQALRNVELILNQARSDRTKVLKVTIYITDLNDWTAVDRACVAFFNSHTTARTIITVPQLHYGFKVEIDVIASC